MGPGRAEFVSRPSCVEIKWADEQARLVMRAGIDLAQSDRDSTEVLKYILKRLPCRVLPQYGFAAVLHFVRPPPLSQYIPETLLQSPNVYLI